MKIEPGKKYNRRDGYVSEVVRETFNPAHPLIAGQYFYLSDGSYWQHGEDGLDLISEYVEPAGKQVAPDANAHLLTVLEKAEAYLDRAMPMLDRSEAMMAAVERAQNPLMSACAEMVTVPTFTVEEIAEWLMFRCQHSALSRLKDQDGIEAFRARKLTPAFDMAALWSELPSWIKWVAMDKNGWWHGYPKEPERVGDYFGCVGASIVIPAKFAPPPAADWKLSLVERPSQTGRAGV